MSTPAATTEQWSELTRGERVMDVFVARPEDDRGAKAVVVVIQEIFGVNSHIQSVTRRIANLGYVAVAPDIFYAQGRRLEADYDEVKLARSRKAQLTDAAFMDDLGALLEWIRSELGSDRKIVLLGFCFGGRLVYLAAGRTPGLSGAVVYYGGGIVSHPPHFPTPETSPPIAVTADISCPLLLFFGGEDPLIPRDEVQKIQQALRDADVRFSLQVYERAGHGFFCEARKDYRKEAAEDSFERLRAFLAEVTAEGDGLRK